MRAFFSFLPIFFATVVSAQTLDRITVFTTTNSVRIDATLTGNPSGQDRYSLRLKDTDGKVLLDQPVTAEAGESGKLVFRATLSAITLWTPLDPRLYEVTLTQNGSTARSKRIGFRMFESKGGNLFLNGKPIFLRGIAINPPERGIPDSIEKSRAFAEDYVRFMKSIHVNIIRIPNNETWYSVCDELGMMVFGGNYSGLVAGEKPPKDYDKAVAWYENKEFAGIASHPSLMVYAMTNETPFQGREVAAWEKFLAYAAAKLKQWDSTRTFIANAGYGYGKAGDICDIHRYWGWYYSSPFTFLHIRNNDDIIPFPKKPQPITFTECVGNYSGPDGRYNLTPDHKNPGSQLNWTGHAPWEEQARLANEHQSFTFREATELFRRLRSVNPELSGVFPFTILFYNWHTIDRFTDMGPKPVTAQAKLSYSPVLVSWENWTSHAFAGTVIHPVLHIVNDADDFSDLNGAILKWEIQDETRSVILSDSIALPAVPYYGTFRKELVLQLPREMQAGHYQLFGRITIGRKTIAENTDKMFIAGHDFVESSANPARAVFLYDPTGATASAFNALHIPYRRVESPAPPGPGTTLVIGENSADAALSGKAASLKQFVANGGRLVFLRQDHQHFGNMNAALAYQLKDFTMDLDTAVYPPPPRPSANGYYLNPETPGHPVFDGIGREELKVWSDYTGWQEGSKTGFPAIYPITDGFVPVNKSDLAHIRVLGNYGPALEGVALAEAFSGKGSVLICGLDLQRRASLDPVAARMMRNIAAYAEQGGHDPYVRINSTIVWGDYGSEKGVLTGINSGLLLNSKPRLTGLYAREQINISPEGNEFANQKSGFNTRPGVQYVPYGRRPFGPYHLEGFGDVPKPDSKDSIGTGGFWCSVPADRKSASTLVWNPWTAPLEIKITVNGSQVSRSIPAGQQVYVDCPVSAPDIHMDFTGDRRLVLLQTSFK